MQRARAIQAFLTILLVVILSPTPAFAHYRSGAGRWLERDMRAFVDGSGLYEYAISRATALQDPRGTDAGWAHRPYPDVWGERSSHEPVDPTQTCGIVVKRAAKSTTIQLDTTWGHEWVEWREPSPDADEPGFPQPHHRKGRAIGIGYWPQQNEPTDFPNGLPPGRIPGVPGPGEFFSDSGDGSTLYGPGNKDICPASCGRNDPNTGLAGDKEWDLDLTPDSTRYVVVDDFNDIDVTLYHTIKYGPGHGVPCSRATCSDIKECLKRVRPMDDWRVVGSNCRDFVNRALGSCCITRGQRTR